MRKLISLIIYALGVLTLLIGIYVSTFYFTRNKIVRPYEADNDNKTHSIRSIYNVIYYPMRKFVANGSSFQPEKRDVYYGTLKEYSSNSSKERGHRYAKIDTPDSFMSIGFTGKQSILKEFDEIKYGSYVRMVFGSALSKKHDRFINRLISFEVIDLMDDPRIEDEDYSEEQVQQIQDIYFGLKGESKTCVAKFTRDYQDRVLEHCLQAGYAQHIGGGCYHLSPYSVTTSVRKLALE